MTFTPTLAKQLIDLRPAGGLQQQVSKFVQAPFHELDNFVYDKMGAPIVTGKQYLS